MAKRKRKEFPTLESCYSPDSSVMISRLHSFVEFTMEHIRNYSTVLSPAVRAGYYDRLSTAMALLSTLTIKINAVK